MSTATAAPAPAQQSADRLPARLRRALLLGVRAQRTQRHVYPDGIYTARNQEWKPAIVLGTEAIERAVEAMTERERAWFDVGVRAATRVRPNSRRMQQARRYSQLLREVVASGDTGQERRLRLWIRTNLLRAKLTDSDRLEAAEAAGRA